MRRFAIVSRAFAFFALFFGPMAICRADVTATGDVTPAPITSWGSSTDGVIGNTASGAISITNGGTLSDRSVIVGYYDGSGQVTVSGTNSVWQNTAMILVGNYNAGSVTQNAGLVTIAGGLYLGGEYGSGHGTYNLNGGTLSLQGLMAYAGKYDFNFNGGVLQADASFTTDANTTLSGTDTINTNGHDVTWNGVLSGSGELVKTGDGTLTLSGNNTYKGGTDVEAGGLIGTVNSIKGDLNVASGATVLFQDTGTITYANAITGGGTLATFSEGGVFNETLLAAGLISPSTSTSALTIKGNYANSSTSTTKIYVDTTSCGQINVAGSASVNGTLQVSGSTCTANTKYTFLTADGGVSGKYSTVTDDIPLYYVSVTYEANDIYFMLSPRTFASVAATWDQFVIGTYLDVVKTFATGDLANMLNQLSGLSDAELRTAYDHLIPAMFGSANCMEEENTLLLDDTVMQQARTQGSWDLFLFFFQFLVDGENCDNSLVYVSRRHSSLDDFSERMKGWRTWASAYGVGASIASDGNAAGIGYSTGGMLVGADRYLDERTLLGFCGGYASSNLNSSDNYGWGSVDGGQGAIYINRNYGFSYLTAVGTYGHNDNVMHRSIEFGTVDRMASSNYGSNVYSASFEAGRYIGLGRVLWQPFASLTYVGVQQDGFTEHGADSLDLNVNSQTANALRSQLGTRMYTRYRTNSGRLVTLNASAAWRHEFLDENSIVDASFAGDTSGNSFISYGVKPDRDVAILGPGLTYALSDHCTIGANYNILTSQNYTAHNGVGSFDYRW